VPLSLPDGYIDLPAGKLANVVTCLETLERPELRPEQPNVSWALTRTIDPDLQWYRALFKRVGEPYLWFSRLALTDDALAHVVRDSRVEIYVVRRNGEEAGFLELDFRVDGECEIVFFGVVEDAIGYGAGRWLMNRAIERAWSHPIRRLWLHTCSLDHPDATPFYLRSGFRPYKRQIEVYDDPRMRGLLSKEAAPHVPLV
jgi:GNAT superfamily N-acetyltransferase